MDRGRQGVLVEVGRQGDEVGGGTEGGREGARTANQLQMSTAEREIKRVKGWRMSEEGWSVGGK